MSDQRTPVEIFTEATWEIEMLSSLLPNRRRFTRLTRSGLTTMRVGNHRFPLVQRLAVKVLSEATVPELAEVGFGLAGARPIPPPPSSRPIRTPPPRCRDRPPPRQPRTT